MASYSLRSCLYIRVYLIVSCISFFCELDDLISCYFHSFSHLVLHATQTIAC
jgi:hypothetical protein